MIHLHLVLLLAIVLDGVGGDFVVVLLEEGKVLTGLWELGLFHTLTDVPVDEGTLGVHEVELVVEAAPGLGDGGGVGEHADGALDLGEVASWDDGRRLVVDTDLEAGRAPVDELDGALGLDGGNGGANILRDDITAVEEGAGHVLAVAWVALNHHVSRLEEGVGDLGDGELLVVGLLGGDDWGIGADWEVDTGVWDEVGLELGEVDVEGTIEAEGGGEGGNNLADETVEIGVGWALDVEGTAAKVVEGLIIDHEGAVGVVNHGVGGKDGVVWLDDSGGNLWSWVDGELELGLLAVVDGKALKEEGAEASTSATTEGVEEEEALETSALVSELTDAVEGKVDDLLTNGVVTTGVVVSGIFLAVDELLWVEELAVRAGTNLVNDSWLEIDENGTWNVLASTSLGEEGVESIIANADGLVGWHLAIWLNAVLEAVEFPATITNLDASLADVDRNNFTHYEE